jgi:hypothetical protein
MWFLVIAAFGMLIPNGLFCLLGTLCFGRFKPSAADLTCWRTTGSARIVIPQPHGTIGLAKRASLEYPPY